MMELYYSVTQKKEWNFVIVNNMDALGGYYGKWTKSDRERQILYDITCMWHIKNKISECNKKQ